MAKKSSIDKTEQAVEKYSLHPSRMASETVVSQYENGSDESTFRSFIENLPVMFYAVEPTSPHTPIYISKTVEKFGYPYKDWMTDPDIWVRVIHEEDRDHILTAAIAFLVAVRMWSRSSS